MRANNSEVIHQESKDGHFHLPNPETLLKLSAMHPVWSPEMPMPCLRVSKLLKGNLTVDLYLRLTSLAKPIFLLRSAPEELSKR